MHDRRVDGIILAAMYTRTIKVPKALTTAPAVLLNALPRQRSPLETERPCALICFNDRLALGAYQALDDSGLKMPADVSAVAFDDHPIATWIRPKLTTVALSPLRVRPQSRRPTVHRDQPARRRRPATYAELLRDGMGTLFAPSFWLAMAVVAGPLFGTANSGPVRRPTVGRES